MDFKEILTKALKDVEGADIDSIADDLTKEVGKSFMPKAKFNEVNDALKAANTQLEETNTKIEELSKNGTVTEELKAELENTKTEYENYKAEADTRVLNIKKQSALEKGLSKRNANQEAIDLLIPTIELEKIQLDKNGDIVDADDIFNPIVEARKSLFGEPVVEGNEPALSNNTPDVNTMSDTEYMEYKLKQSQ